MTTEKPSTFAGLDTAQIDALNEKYLPLKFEERLKSLYEDFDPAKVMITSSFAATSAYFLHIVSRIRPEQVIQFIDTGYHFPETLETVERVRRHYGLNLRMMTVPPHDEELWKVDPENCCSAIKVGQLDRALAGKEAWMSGLRRAESPTRANAPIVVRDLRGLVKVNPLATWSDLDVEGYIRDHDIITNPLLSQGYLSIGCWPCTKPVAEGEDPRSGRWSGSDKTECGLHL
jgi:phosphoadenosine phosphosulfate reductase